MSNYILYGYWRSSCSYRVRIALYLKGIPFEYRAVHLVKDGGQQHDEEYRKLNPMRQVPSFHDVDAGLVFNQSFSIIDYLEMKYPEPALFPKDPIEAIRVRELCEMINSGIQPLQNLGGLQQLEVLFNADADGKAAWAAHFIKRGFEGLEAKVAQTAGRFCYGDSVTAIDLFLVPQVYGANRFGVDMDQFPNLKRINETCLSLEAFQKAEPSVQPDAQ